MLKCESDCGNAAAEYMLKRIRCQTTMDGLIEVPNQIARPKNCTVGIFLYHFPILSFIVDLQIYN